MEDFDPSELTEQELGEVVNHLYEESLSLKALLKAKDEEVASLKASLEEKPRHSGGGSGNSNNGLPTVDPNIVKEHRQKAKCDQELLQAKMDLKAYADRESALRQQNEELSEDLESLRGQLQSVSESGTTGGSSRKRSKVDKSAFGFIPVADPVTLSRAPSQVGLDSEGNPVNEFPSFDKGGYTISIGDCVLLTADSGLPFMGEVTCISLSKSVKRRVFKYSDSVQPNVTVFWYYRPEDVVTGGLNHADDVKFIEKHHANEVFPGFNAPENTQENSVSVVEGKFDCQPLTARNRGGKFDGIHFVSRRKYHNGSKKLFAP
eukprot:TRINITY_DN15483_c0_g1_i1.p1 TRINITY_DN15483_c0_g1~~TRINITY_DN15483_c0_g1_i1.p1  ORF type:complete len:319 (-),score=59.43 TRINITY_DN15483_c0_g1_i1:47-1003(-)